MRHRLRVKLVILGFGSALTVAALAACSIDIDGTGAAPADSGPLADVTFPKLDGAALDAAPTPDARPADAADEAAADADAGDSGRGACDGGAYSGNNAALFTGDPAGFINVSKLVATGDFTLEAWIAPTAVTSSGAIDQGNQLFIADVPGPGHNDWASYLYTPSVAHMPVVAFATGSGMSMVPDSLGFTNKPIPISATPPPSWTHIAIVRIQSQGLVKFFLNGTDDVDTPDASTSALTDPTYMAIGGSILGDGGARNGFSGLIDEVRVWNYARAASDIATDVVDELCPDVVTDARLVLYYKLDESGAATTVHDSSGSKLDGALMGDGGAKPTFTAVTNR